MLRVFFYVDFVAVLVIGELPTDTQTSSKDT